MVGLGVRPPQPALSLGNCSSIDGSLESRLDFVARSSPKCIGVDAANSALGGSRPWRPRSQIIDPAEGYRCTSIG